MDDSPHQINADEKAGDKKDASQNQQIPATKLDDAVQSRLAADWFDNVFKFIGGIAIVSWMIHEFVFDTHKLFLFSAIGLALADAFYVLAHKILKNWVWLVLCWALYVVCIMAIFKNESSPKQDSMQIPAQTIIAIPPPDYIEGTQITPKQLDGFFPFGYAVIYLNDAAEKQIHEVHNKLFDWKWDWNKVKIEPDFVLGKVTWTLPPVFSASGSRGDLQFSNVEIVGTTRLTNEIVRARFAYTAGVPCPYVGILSVSQRNPVFVVGFRIPQSQNEIFFPP